MYASNETTPGGCHLSSAPCPWDCGRGGHIVSSESLPTREKPIVLIVGDESATDSLVMHALQQVGVEILVARDPAGSLELINKVKPNLVLLDAAMADGCGYDLCRSVQLGSEYRAPVIFISSQQDLPAKVRALECGAVDFICKPLMVPEVVARVRTHLRLQKALQTLADAHEAHLKTLAAAQQSCMPAASEMPKAKFYVGMRQVHLAGGDIYDVMDLGEQQFGYVVADATGHDLSSTFWTLALKTLLLEYSGLLFSPVDAFYLINRALIRILPEGVFFTAAYARVNRAAGTVQLLNAAHPPAIYLPVNGTPRLIEQASDVIGCFTDATFSRFELQVHPGDRLFLFSDGLMDCLSNPEGGPERLFQAICTRKTKRLDETVNGVLHELLGEEPPQDDALLMGIEI